jgi:hypothetical protein
MASAVDLISDEEEFHSSYRVFIRAIEVLSYPAEQQCSAMGDYNVAWEMKEDAAAGKYLVGRGYLSPSQEAWVSALAAALEAVPAQVLPAGKGRDKSLEAMRHPSWVPLRAIAVQTLEALHPFTTANSKYLQLD